MALSSEDQKKIDKAKKDYDDAKSKGDQAGMDKAHSDAESVRNKNGYSGGADGSQHISTDSSSKSSGSKKKSKSEMSNDDENKILEAKKMWESANAAGDTAAMEKAHELAESVRNKYGYSGGADGSQTVSLGNINSGIFQDSTVARNSNDYSDFNNAYHQQISDVAKKYNVDLGVAADMVHSDARYGTGNSGSQYGNYAVTDAMRKAEQLAFENNIKNMDGRNFDAVGDAFSSTYDFFKEQGNDEKASEAHNNMENVRKIRDPQYQGSADGSGFNQGQVETPYFADYSQYFQPQQIQTPQLVQPDTTEFDTPNRRDYDSQGDAPQRSERASSYVDPNVAEREARIQKLLEFRQRGGK